MKKFIFLTFLLTTFCVDASAKTQGAQIGVDVIYTFENHRYLTDQSQVTVEKFKDSASSYGATFKYAFNIDKILLALPIFPTYIAPGIFYEKIGIDSSFNPEFDSLQINNRYGFKVDVGMDFTDYFALYGTIGAANSNYVSEWKAFNEKMSGSQMAVTYGGGVAFTFKKHLVIGLEYNTQKMKVRTPLILTANSGNINKADVKMDIVKLSLAYRF